MPTSSPARALGSALLVLAVATAAGAQEPADRPRIGLVLSGGGARGIAHIGVLETLEELRVPVDLVVGTSMGALVGGLYAAGVPVDRIRAFVSTADWDALLADTPVRASLDFPLRARQRRYTVEIEAGLTGDGVILPGGLIAGQELGLLLRRATAPVASIEDFGALPIPYAAVATDIASFERVVLDRGDLVEAMRASMAIPVAIAPVEVDGRLLVDGGLVDDLPVALAREMGADLVIAVDVTPPLLERHELSGFVDIAEQIARGLGRIGVDAERESADVAIVPDLEGVSVFDFRRSGEIRERGVAAGRAAADSLRGWTLSPDAYADHRGRRAARIPRLPSAISEVRIAASAIDERLVRARMDRDLLRAFDWARAERLARRAYATGLFERVGWDVAGSDPAALVIDGPLHPQGPRLLLGGVDLVLDSAGESPPRVTFESVLGFVRTRIGARAAEWRVDLRLGSRGGVETAFRQPLDFAGRWFLEPFVSALRIERPVFHSGRTDAEYETDLVAAGLDVGRTLGGSAEVRAGLRAERARSALEPAAEEAGRFPDEEETTVELRGALVVDRLDAVGIPRHGTYVRVSTYAAREELGADRNRAVATLDARIYGSARRHTLFARGEVGGSSPAGDLPAKEEFLLGGFGSLTGYADGELRGEAFAVARAGWLVRVAELPPAFRAFVAGGWIDVGDAWDPSVDEDPGARATGTLAVGLETQVGPVFLAWTPVGGDGRVTLSLGRSP